MQENRLEEEEEEVDMTMILLMTMSPLTMRMRLILKKTARRNKRMGMTPKKPATVQAR